MKLKGKIKSITPRLFPTRAVEILLETEEDVTAELTKLMVKDLAVEIKRWIDKRTLTANSYYWQLVTEMAKALSKLDPEAPKITNAEVHNRLLRDYGAFAEFGNRPVRLEILDTEEAEEQTLQDHYFHIYPTAELVFKGEETYRVYYLLKGSHEMTKEEFGRLLDGLIEECKNLGVETETPDEIARMMALWNQY